MATEKGEDVKGKKTKRKPIRTLEDVPYYKFFKALSDKRGIKGHPFLDREDLLQEVFLTWLETERDYKGEFDQERLVKRAAKLHVLTLVRDRFFSEHKKMERYTAFPELVWWIVEPVQGYKLEEADLKRIITNQLSDDGKILLEELLDPSYDTIMIAFQHMARRQHLANHGKIKKNVNRLIISSKVIIESINFSTARYYKCMKEIRQAVQILKEPF